jgi:hypothetical protein
MVTSVEQRAPVIVKNDRCLTKNPSVARRACFIPLPLNAHQCRGFDRHQSPQRSALADLRETGAKAQENWLHRGALRSIGQFMRVVAQVVRSSTPSPSLRM